MIPGKRKCFAGYSLRETSSEKVHPRTFSSSADFHYLNIFIIIIWDCTFSKLKFAMNSLCFDTTLEYAPTYNYRVHTVHMYSLLVKYSPMLELQSVSVLKRFKAHITNCCLTGGLNIFFPARMFAALVSIEKETWYILPQSCPRVCVSEC
jgi:hypothetical protein